LIHENVLEFFEWHYLGKHSFKVKTKTSILRFHPPRKLPSKDQIIGSCGAAPVIGSKIPLGDVLGLGVIGPGFLSVRQHGRLNGDFGKRHLIYFLEIEVLFLEWVIIRFFTTHQRKLGLKFNYLSCGPLTVVC
jgi:hypothetical protein